MARTTFRIILFAYFTLSALHEKVLKIIDLGFNSGIILAPFGINFQYFFDIDFSINLLMPFFQTLDRTCLHLGSLSDLSWKMVAKREPPGAPKIPIFLTFSPKAPQALQDPLPRRLRGSFFHDFGINFTISDQQKHYFEDHSLIILAFIFTISDQRKH